jgi:hypothetical protein
MSQRTSNAQEANFGRFQKNMDVPPQLDDAPKQLNKYLPKYPAIRDLHR